MAEVVVEFVVEVALEQGPVPVPSELTLFVRGIEVEGLMSN